MELPDGPAEGRAHYGAEPERVGGAAVVEELAEGAVGGDGDDVEVRQQARDGAPREGAAAEAVSEGRLAHRRAEERLGCRVHGAALQRSARTSASKRRSRW